MTTAWELDITIAGLCLHYFRPATSTLLATPNDLDGVRPLAVATWVPADVATHPQHQGTASPSKAAENGAVGSSEFEPPAQIRSLEEDVWL